MKSNQDENQLTAVLRMIKFEHTLFALPFAFLGMMLAAEGWPSWRTVGWIIVAMVGVGGVAARLNRKGNIYGPIDRLAVLLHI